MRQLILASLLFLAGIQISAQQTYSPNWESLDKRPTPEWWQDAKFGIFIHWGAYSVPAYTTKGNYAEWYQNFLENNSFNGAVRDYHKKKFGSRTYYDLADDFKAELYNPDEWAQLFEKAGAKYVVLTSKHHDGFCLWPNQNATKTWGFPWNSAERGPKRDLLGDLFTALEKTSVKPGLYFSLYEWFNPLWKKDPKRFASEHTMPQLYELANRYKPWVIWSDGDWDASPETWQSPQFLAWLYNESPIKNNVVVNDRWGTGVRFKHAGIYTPEYQPELDFEDHAWEESRGMGFSYGYNRLEDAWDYNSTQSLILHLVDKVSRGGNFLLDIGPDEHGKIPPIMQDRLLEMGKWLSVNGEAIYNTRRWRTPSQWSDGRRDWKGELIDGWRTAGDALLKQTIDPDPGFAVQEAFFTWNPKSENLYAILPQYPEPERGNWTLKGVELPSTVNVTLLATGQMLKHSAVQGNTVIEFPPYSPNKIKTPQAFVLKFEHFGKYASKPQIQLTYQKNPEQANPMLSFTTAQASAQIRYTTNGSDPNENSKLYSMPFVLENDATLKARVFASGMLESSVVEQKVSAYPIQAAMSMFREPEAGLQRSLVTTNDKYSISSILTGNILLKSIVKSLELDTFCEKNKCGLLWNGYYRAPETDIYEFRLTSDDGSTFRVDAQILIDNAGDHGPEEKLGTIYLQKGWHKIQVRYYNSGGGATFNLRCAQGGGEAKALDPESLAH